MMTAPVLYSSRSYRSVDRAAAPEHTSQSNRGLARTLHRQLPSAITYNADEAYHQLLTPPPLCPPVLNCCSTPLLACRRCLRGACQSSKRPWKIVLLLVLVLSGIQMLANVTFYRHSNSLFFFNLSNPLIWTPDGRPFFEERWVRSQNAVYSSSFTSVNNHFNESLDIKLIDKLENDSFPSNDDLKYLSNPKMRLEKSKQVTFPVESGNKYLQNSNILSKHDSVDARFLSENKALGSVRSHIQEKSPPNSTRQASPAASSPSEVRRQKASHNMTASVPHKSLLSDELSLCPPVPPNLVGSIKVDVSPANLLEEESLHPELMPGGRWLPPDCRSRHKVAIIIPYRARAQSLAILLRHLHPFLQRQQLDYGIFVVEQAGFGKFNRAMLLNVGALESLKLYPYECFIFHDIDLLAEDDRNLYSCPQQPRHMSVAIDTMNYQLPYNDIFGGVSALSVKHMRKVNGFSNKFWGWGGEDDDMSNRLKFYGLYISRYPANIARYTMLSHKKEAPNPQRYQTLFAGKKRFKTDGLNSIQYRVLDVQLRKLFTWIYVELHKS